jgi:putative inorganic carbon (hco3(-)) transporter
MNVTKNDLFYILMSIAVASIGVVAVNNSNSNVGLYGLLGLLGIAVVMAIIIKPSLGANILVFAVFTNISDLLSRLGFPGILKPLVVIVAVALFVRYLYAGQMQTTKSKTARIEFFLLAYFMIVVASFLVATDKDRALTEILDMGKDIIIIYSILFALRQPQTWKQTIWLIIITTALLCSLSVYQLFTHNYTETFIRLASVQMDKVFGDASTARIGGPINAPNLWGQILVAVSTLLIFRILHEKHPLVKLAGVVMLGIISYVVLNTFSRGAYLVLAIDVVLILFVFEKRVRPLVAIAGIAILILLIPLLPSNYRARFGSLTAFSSQSGIYQDTSLRGRSSEMLTGLAMFAEHPILGVGAANYFNNYQRYAQLVGIEFRATGRDPHSLYVQLLAETGILGTIAFLGMLYFLFDALNKACRAIDRSRYLHEWLPWINGIRLALLSYLLTSIFLHNAFFRYFWIFVAMALAGIQITYNLLENSERTLSVEAQR